MTTTYTIAKILGRDGIRTRTNGEIAYAKLDLGDFTLTIQTRADDDARPVFHARGDELIAENDAAVAHVETSRAAAQARAAAAHEAMLAGHELAETRFGPITIGTPKQIAYAEIKRGQNFEAVLRYLDRVGKWRDTTGAQEVLSILPRLFPRADFWLDCSHDLGAHVEAYMSRRDVLPLGSAIGRMLADG